MTIKIYPLGAKLKDTLYNGTIGRYTTKSHKEGEFSVTGDTFIIRKVTELEQKGRLNEIKEKYSSMYQKMQQMDNEFKKLIPTLFPKKYFRGIMGKENEGVRIIIQAKTGDIIMPDKGYAFITKSKEIAHDYACYLDGSARGENVLMEIILPSGSKYSKNPLHLREAVMPRGAKYKVIDKKESDGMTHVVLKYLPDEK